ncbi:hypothetical protein SCHPADRAFT_749000 [Schizopora paradoxa]|uniref:Uncharacterized protein n=1 Tax=Schizopora paradoxa TaxID=27342 RepID=A0A0H2RIF9_9AGAM|nr:hypothetical protein SCHPADRAFT_749000 [Schizopora paradoxa]
MSPSFIRDLKAKLKLGMRRRQDSFAIRAHGGEEAPDLPTGTVAVVTSSARALIPSTTYIRGLSQQSMPASTFGPLLPTHNATVNHLPGRMIASRAHGRTPIDVGNNYVRKSLDPIEIGPSGLRFEYTRPASVQGANTNSNTRVIESEVCSFTTTNNSTNFTCEVFDLLFRTSRHNKVFEPTASWDRRTSCKCGIQTLFRNGPWLLEALFFFD